MTVYSGERTCAAAAESACQAGAGLTYRTLCEPCLVVGRAAVLALPADWVDLEQLIPRSLGVWGDGQPHGSGEAPVPINLHVEAQQAAILRVVTTWEEVVRDARRLADPPRRRPGPQVRRFVASAATAPRCEDYSVVSPMWIDGRAEHPSARDRPMRAGAPDVLRACTLLAAHLEALADVPEVELADYPLAEEDEWVSVRPGWLGVLDLVALHRRAGAALGLTRPERYLPGLCGGCDHSELRQEQPRFRGDERPVYCGWCNKTQSYDDYLRDMHDWVAA